MPFPQGLDEATGKMQKGQKKDCHAGGGGCNFPPAANSSAVSSVVEHHLDTVGVAGSKPAPRTIFLSNAFKNSIIKGIFCHPSQWDDSYQPTVPTVKPWVQHSPKNHRAPTGRFIVRRASFL